MLFLPTYTGLHSCALQPLVVPLGLLDNIQIALCDFRVHQEHFCKPGLWSLDEHGLRPLVTVSSWGTSLHLSQEHGKKLEGDWM